MNQSIFILLAAYMLAATTLPAQTDTNRRETSVVFFGSEPSTKEKKLYNAQAIKFGLLDIASGLYGFHYEKELGMLVSIQAGAGLTGRNFIQSALENDRPSGDKSTYFIDNDELDYWYDFDTRKSGIGYFIVIHPKLYYDEEGIDGKFFGVIFQYRKHTFEAQGLDPTSNEIAFSPLVPAFNEYENQSIFAVSWGSQTLNKRTALEGHFAVGMRNIKGRRRDTGYLYDSPFGTSYPGAVLADVSKTQFYFETTFRIGLWWK